MSAEVDEPITTTRPLDPKAKRWGSVVLNVVAIALIFGYAAGGAVAVTVGVGVVGAIVAGVVVGVASWKGLT